MERRRSRRPPASGTRICKEGHGGVVTGTGALKSTRRQPDTRPARAPPPRSPAVLAVEALHRARRVWPVASSRASVAVPPGAPPPPPLLVSPPRALPMSSMSSSSSTAGACDCASAKPVTIASSAAKPPMERSSPTKDGRGLEIRVAKSSPPALGIGSRRQEACDAHLRKGARCALPECTPACGQGASCLARDWGAVVNNVYASSVRENSKDTSARTARCERAARLARFKTPLGVGRRHKAKTLGERSGSSTCLRSCEHRSDRAGANRGPRGGGMGHVRICGAERSKSRKGSTTTERAESASSWSGAPGATCAFHQGATRTVASVSSSEPTAASAPAACIAAIRASTATVCATVLGASPVEAAAATPVTAEEGGWLSLPSSLSLKL
eukprot:scaffold72791_cov26-Tisochrysis_lutea.AAC.2